MKYFAQSALWPTAHRGYIAQKCFGYPIYMFNTENHRGIHLYYPISHATYMGFIQYYQITSQPVNQAICIFITVTIVYFVILFQ